MDRRTVVARLTLIWALMRLVVRWGIGRLVRSRHDRAGPETSPSGKQVRERTVWYAEEIVDPGPEPRPERWPRVKRLLWLIYGHPNPDLEPILYRVGTWWLELDEHGTVCREIGFDANGQAIVLGPVGDNYGSWTDSPTKWEREVDLESDPAVADRFETTWAALWPEFVHLAEKAGRDRPWECP
jgi:hypothetical protein